MFNFHPSISSFSTGATSLFFFINAYIIYRSWKKNKTPLLRYFLIFLISFGCQQMLFSLGTGTLSLNPIVNSWLWSLAHLFMFIGLSYFIRFPFSVQFPKIEKTAFSIALVYAVMGISYFFLTASQPAVHSQLLTNSTFVYFVPPAHAVIIVIFTSITMLTSIVILIYNALKSSDLVIRRRSLLISLAILLFLTGGPVHNFVRTPILTFIADGMIVVSMLIMMAGIYIKKFIRQSAL